MRAGTWRAAGLLHNARVKNGSTSSKDEALVSARDALAMLGVKAQTLYSYVSRGLIRVAPSAADGTRMYFRKDVEAVTAKGRSDLAATSAAERSLRWGGAAVLHTAITFVGPGGPVYRGQAALDLARAGRSFEECAELLWNGALPKEPPVWPAPAVPRVFADYARVICAVAPQNSSRHLLALVANAFIATAERGGAAEPGRQERDARQLIQVLASAFGLLRARPRLAPPGVAEPIAMLVAQASGIGTARPAIAALNACLVVTADHELTSSTFVARIAASAGADGMSCISSALASFEGQKNGLGCDECEQALAAAGSRKAYLAAIARSLAERRPIAGYDHYVYPDGDPRGEYLVEIATALAGKRADTAWMVGWIAAARAQLGVRPSVVAGLVAVCAALGMPRRSAGALMALSRTAGWLAHSTEQRLSGVAVRPRARYIGVSPPER
ncbi:MAG: citrate synthase family protein [Ramlibacter sp.]|nr:citrate synthase family protein [Ramlibacter sp.]